MTDSIAKVIADMRELEADYTERALVREWADRLAALDGWRPIESAPKDGKTEIILFDPHEIFVGFRPADCPDDAACDLMGTACYPSHWMPLPAPPKGTKE